MSSTNLAAIFGGRFEPDDQLNQLWNETEAAPEMAPLPAGNYLALIVKGAKCESRTGTAGFRITFKVEEGESAGRFFWHTVWFSHKAMPYAKRDLLKLGITSPAQIDAPYPPPGIRMHGRAQVVFRKEDDGTQRNEVRNFEVLSHEDEPRDPLAPTDAELGGDAAT